MYCDRPDMDDLPHKEWKCEHCEALNSMWDADCQYCDHVEAFGEAAVAPFIKATKVQTVNLVEN